MNVVLLYVTSFLVNDLTNDSAENRYLIVFAGTLIHIISYHSYIITIIKVLNQTILLQRLSPSVMKQRCR